LTGAAVLVGLEALGLVVLGISELGVLSGSRATMGLTTSLFFVLYGAGLAAFAWLLVRLRSWTRAPVVLSQLIQLGLAWSFLGGGTVLVAVALGVVALLVLAGVFHPASIAALAAADAAEAAADGRGEDPLDGRSP
jgi:hypothetical protein